MEKYTQQYVTDLYKFLRRQIISRIDKNSPTRRLVKQIPINGLELAKNILADLSSDLKKNILRSMCAKNPAIAILLSDERISLKDIRYLNNQDVFFVMRELKDLEIIYLLRHSSPQLVKKILSALSSQRSRDLKKGLLHCQFLENEEAMEIKNRIIHVLNDLYRNNKITLAPIK